MSCFWSFEFPCLFSIISLGVITDPHKVTSSVVSLHSYQPSLVLTMALAVCAYVHIRVIACVSRDTYLSHCIYVCTGICPPVRAYVYPPAYACVREEACVVLFLGLNGSRFQVSVLFSSLPGPYDSRPLLVPRPKHYCLWDANAEDFKGDFQISGYSHYLARHYYYFLLISFSKNNSVF